eukprot:201003_1
MSTQPLIVWMLSVFVCRSVDEGQRHHHDLRSNVSQSTHLPKDNSDNVIQLSSTISSELIATIALIAVMIVLGVVYTLYKKKPFPPRQTNKNKQKQTKHESTDLNLVLYANGLYESLEKPNDLWTHGIIQSDFSTIVLWTLHIRRSGDLVYNDFLMVANGILQPTYDATGTNIASRIQELKASQNVERILFSIGSGSWYDSDGQLTINPDFYNLHHILFAGTQQEKDNLYNNFKVLIDLGIDGFDSDCEEWGFFSDLTSQHLEETHVELFSKLYYQFPHLIFTFVPYRHRSNWLNIAKQLYALVGQQIVKFWIVQMYGPGSGTVKGWIHDIALNAEELGLDSDEVERYIIPGYNNSGEYWPSNTPSRVRQIFTGLNDEQLQVKGGMIWNLSQTYERAETLLAYSQAIIEGLTSTK